MEDVRLRVIRIRTGNNYGRQASHLVETLKLAAIHAMTVRSDKQVARKPIVAADAQIQDVVQNFGHHVQASLESIEFDLMGLGNNAARAHVLDGEHYE